MDSLPEPTEKVVNCFSKHHMLYKVIEEPLEPFLTRGQRRRQDEWRKSSPSIVIFLSSDNAAGPTSRSSGSASQRRRTDRNYKMVIRCSVHSPWSVIMWQKHGVRWGHAGWQGGTLALAGGETGRGLRVWLRPILEVPKIPLLFTKLWFARWDNLAAFWQAALCH